MSSRPKVSSPVLRYCADCAVLLGCWTLWLVLGALFVVQIGIAFSNELKLPAFVLRSLEARFDASHVKARFGNARFDPAGRVLLENLQLSIPEFGEPVVDVRAVFIELDPWFLLVGRLEPRRIQATGVKLFAPAMLAPSGRREEIVSDLEFGLTPGSNVFDVQYLTTRLAGVAVDLHGGFQIQRSHTAGAVAPLPLIENIANHYAAVSRQFIRIAAELAPFEQPELHAILTPSPNRGAVADATFTTRNINLSRFDGAKLAGVTINTRLPLLGDTPVLSPLLITVDELRIDGAIVKGVYARTDGSLRLAQYSYIPRRIEMSIRDASARGFALQSVAARFQPGSLSDMDATAIAECAGSPISLSSHVNFNTKSAVVRFDGALAPALLEPVGKLIGRDVRAFIGFGAPVNLAAEARFNAGWKFERLDGRVAATHIDAYHVAIDSAHGEIEFDGRHFTARNAIARLGENFARGSFEQDLATLEFRFLLEGQLRPLDISGWFHDWWPDFFEHFEFPVAPPDASVDVTGRWRAGHQTTVFVFAEGSPAIIRGAKFDYARTLLFIRPNFLDGLELFGTRGAGDLKGTFTRHVDIERNEWSEMSLALDSTIDLEGAAKLLGPTLATELEPFTFENAPHLKINARFDGPAAPGGEHHTMQIDAQSIGAFSLYRFPARNLSFGAKTRDDDLVLDHIEASVASGLLSGKAELTGAGKKRRLRFDATLHEANLAEAIATLRSRAAPSTGQVETGTEKFLPGKANVKVDLALSAEGQFGDPFSYQGVGNAALDGPQLGEVRLLGLLSDLLNFTALRFTSARADFKLDGSKLTFPTVNVTGANSAIQAHGDYFLDRHELDFKARVYPFQESKSLVQSVVGAVLTPLSTVLEVKLTGPLDQPKWAFVIGPTNFLRSLNQPAPAQEAQPGQPTNEPNPDPKGQPDPADAKTH